jgi:hypothetical protein
MKLVGNMVNIFKRSAFFVPLNVKICRQIHSQTFFSFERGRKACAHGLWRLHLAGLKRSIIGNKLLRNVIACQCLCAGLKRFETGTNKCIFSPF